MFPMELCLDSGPFSAKPSSNDIIAISKRIGGYRQQINTVAELQSVIKKISEHGHTFCPATFKNGTRKKDNFEQQQIIALDFDNSDPRESVSLDEVTCRASKYNLGIVAAYETFSSENCNRFRILLVNDAPISNVRIMEAMQLALGTIFHEADPSCIKDVSKLYFGGKKSILFEENIPTISVEAVFRALTYCLEDQYKNHYREKITKFADMTGIALNDKGFKESVEVEEINYLALVRGIYKNGSLHIAKTPKGFDPDKHDGLIYYDCLCLRRKSLEREIRRIEPHSSLDECVSALLSKGALKLVGSKNTVQVNGTGGKRFYAIKLNKLR